MIDENVSKPWQTSLVEKPAISILIHELGKQLPDWMPYCECNIWGVLLYLIYPCPSIQTILHIVGFSSGLVGWLFCVGGCVGLGSCSATGSPKSSYFLFIQNLLVWMMPVLPHCHPSMPLCPTLILLLANTQDVCLEFQKALQFWGHALAHVCLIKRSPPSFK